MNKSQTQASDYELKSGILSDFYGLFVPSTINTGAQISADRIEDKSLCNKLFYTSNVSLATKRNGKVLLGLGGTSAFNVVFGTNTQKICQELKEGFHAVGYVHLTPDKNDSILMLEKSGDVVFVGTDDLDLNINYGSTHAKFIIRTHSFERDITFGRMIFVNAGFGSGYMLEKVMDNLRGNYIEEITIYTMNPKYLSKIIKDDEIVARVSVLGDFCGRGINFSVGYYGIDNSSKAFAWRGLLKNPTEVGTSKSCLESLIGKGTDVGNGLVVVRKDQITDLDYAILTEKQ